MAIPKRQKSHFNKHQSSLKPTKLALNLTNRHFPSMIPLNPSLDKMLGGVFAAKIARNKFAPNSRVMAEDQFRHVWRQFLPHLRKASNIALWIAQLECSCSVFFNPLSPPALKSCCTVVRRSTLAFSFVCCCRIKLSFKGYDYSSMINKDKVWPINYFVKLVPLWILINHNLMKLFVNLLGSTTRIECWLGWCCFAMKLLLSCDLCKHPRYHDSFTNNLDNIYCWMGLTRIFYFITNCDSWFVYKYQHWFNKNIPFSNTSFTNPFLWFMLLNSTVCSFCVLFCFCLSTMDVDKGKGKATFASVTISDPSLINIQKISNDYQNKGNIHTNAPELLGANTKGTKDDGKTTKPVTKLVSLSGTTPNKALGFNPHSLFAKLAEAREQGNKKKELTLVGFLVGDQHEFPKLFTKLRLEWRPIKGTVSFTPLKSGWFEIVFSNQVDFNIIWNERPYHVFSQLLLIKKWDPKFNPTTESIYKLDLWVRLFFLPEEFANPQSLTAILEENNIGTLIRMDPAHNSNRQNLFTRFCINTDISITLKKKVLIPDEHMNIIKHKLWFDDIPDGCGACGMRGHEYEECTKRINQIPTLNITLRKSAAQNLSANKAAGESSSEGPWNEMGPNNKVIKDVGKKLNLAKPYLKPSSGVKIMYEFDDSDELQILTDVPSNNPIPEDSAKIKSTKEQIDKFFGKANHKARANQDSISTQVLGPKGEIFAFSNRKPRQEPPFVSSENIGDAPSNPIICDDPKAQMEDVIGSMSWNQIYQQTKRSNSEAITTPDPGSINQEYHHSGLVDWTNDPQGQSLLDQSSLMGNHGFMYYFGNNIPKLPNLVQIPITTFLNENTGDIQSSKGGSSTFFLINDDQQAAQEDGKLSHEESNEDDIDYLEEEDPIKNFQAEDGGEEEEEDPMEDDLDVFYNEEDYNPELPATPHQADQMVYPMSPEPLVFSLLKDTQDHDGVVLPQGHKNNKVYKRRSLSNNSSGGLDSKLSSSSVINKLTNLEMTKSESGSHSSKRKNWDSVVDTATSDAQGTKKPKPAN